MLKRIPKLKSGVIPSSKDFNALVDRVNGMSNIVGRGGITVKQSNQGVSINPIGSRPPLRLYKIQSLGTGDGIYTCHHVTVGATDWAAVTLTDKYVKVNEVDTDVWNLDENYRDGQELSLGDYLQSWQVSDDEGNKRWVGRRANLGVGWIRWFKLSSGSTVPLVGKRQTCNAGSFSDAAGAESEYIYSQPQIDKTHYFTDDVVAAVFVGNCWVALYNQPVPFDVCT